MNCDTLRSYNYRIDKSECYIERASIGYDPTIKDDNRAFRGIATKTYLDLDKKHPSAWCTTLESNPFIRWNDLDATMKKLQELLRRKAIARQFRIPYGISSRTRMEQESVQPIMY